MPRKAEVPPCQTRGIVQERANFIPVLMVPPGVSNKKIVRLFVRHRESWLLWCT